MVIQLLKKKVNSTVNYYLHLLIMMIFFSSQTQPQRDPTHDHCLLLRTDLKTQSLGCIEVRAEARLGQSTCPAQTGVWLMHHVHILSLASQFSLRPAICPRETISQMVTIQTAAMTLESGLTEPHALILTEVGSPCVRSSMSTAY